MAGQALLLWHNDKWIGANGSILSCEDRVVLEQPSQLIKSLFVANDKLYCGHTEPPHLTAYSITSAELIKLETPITTAFQISQIKNFNNKSTVFNRQGDAVTEYQNVTQYINLSSDPQYPNWKERVSDYMEITYQYTKKGVFIAEKPEKTNDNLLSVTAYDRMSLFSVIIDDWTMIQTYPTTTLEALQGLCTLVGVPLKNATFLNADFPLKERHSGENVTARDLLQWIAQIAAAFAVFTADGELELRWYQHTDKLIDCSNYVNIDVSDYAVKPIDKLQIKVTESDIGVIVGTGANAYIIQNNPLLYAINEQELLEAADNIFNVLKAVVYTPFSANVTGTMLNVGDIVAVTTRKGQQFISPIMQISEKPGITTVKSTGNKIRTTQMSAVNREIMMLRGRMNEIIATIEEFSVTLSEYIYNIFGDYITVDTLTNLPTSPTDEEKLHNYYVKDVEEFYQWDEVQGWIFVSQAITNISQIKALSTSIDLTVKQITDKNEQTGTINLKKDKVEFSFNQIGKQGNAQYGAVIDNQGLHSYSANNMGMSLQNGQVVIQNNGSFIGNVGFDTSSSGNGIGIRAGYGTNYIALGKQIGANSFQNMLALYPNGYQFLKSNSCVVTGDLYVGGNIHYEGNLYKQSNVPYAMPATMSLNEDDSTTFEAIEIPISYDPFMIPTGGE